MPGVSSTGQQFNAFGVTQGPFVAEMDSLPQWQAHTFLYEDLYLCDRIRFEKAMK